VGTSDDRQTTLVIHPGALGDVLQSVPALRALRCCGPLAFSGQARFGRLLDALGVIDAALPFDTLGLEALFTREPLPSSLVTRLAGFDQIVSWFGAKDDVYRARLRAIAKDSVVVPSQPAEGSHLSVWQHLLATTGREMESHDRPEIAPIDPRGSCREGAARTLATLGVLPSRPMLVVHPGAGGVSKLWPVERYARVVDWMMSAAGVQILIHRGPADAEVAERLSRLLDGRAAHLVEPELPLLAAVLARAAAYLGGDSGVSHLAAAVGAPAVILFPPATRERWSPWSPTARCLTMRSDDDQVDEVTAALGAAMRAS